MKCIICLSSFENNEAFIPELDCSCVFVTHYECWEEWEKVGNCLYCRQSQPRPQILLEPIPPSFPSIQKIFTLILCSYLGVLLFIYIIIIIFLAVNNTI